MEKGSKPPIEQYNPHEAKIDERLVDQVIEEIPRFMEEVKSEKEGLTQKEIFLEARKRALRFLNIPWDLWGDFYEVVGRKMSERKKGQKPEGGKIKTSATKRKTGFSSWSTEALIRDSYNAMRQRGGDPDDLDGE